VAQALPVVPLDVPEPLAQVHVDERGSLLGIGHNGRVWQGAEAGWRPLGNGLDPAAPLASGHGRTAGRTLDGGLWLLQAGRVQTTAGRRLAAHGGLLMQADGVVALAADARPSSDQHRLIRLAPDARGHWVATARGADSVLPDARPVAFDPGAADSPLAVLAGPDGQRYPHGALGDKIEATRLLLVDPLHLHTVAALNLPEPYVFEDLAPRPIAWRGGRALLTMRAGPQGGQLAVVARDADGGLALAASGAPIGTRFRWLAPATDGTALLAVHTPHIGGVLVAYQDDGAQRLGTLFGTPLGGGFSNHQYGERELGLSLWFGSGLLLPAQDRRSLLLVETGGPAAGRDSARWVLPGPVLALRRWPLAGQPGAVALLADGQLVALAVKPLAR
jgi:hypothetical protein